MSTIGEIELIAKINTANYKKGAREIEATNKDIEGSTEKAGMSFTRLASTVKVASVAAAAAVGALFVASVKGTANLEQSLGGSEVVFGEYSKEIQNLARESAKVMGTSQNQYLETANKMGSLFQGAGFDVRKSMELTSQAMQRATDVATAMGISTDMALESIAGAAKGNFTMMDNLGVKMTAASIEAYALSKGIDKAFDSMTETEKAGFAMQQFMEVTAKYAGNYARENDTLSGSFQTLKAAIGNLLSGVESSDQQVFDAVNNMKNVLARELPVIATTLAKSLTNLMIMTLQSVDWVAVYQSVIPDAEIRANLEKVINVVTGFISTLVSVVVPLTDWLARNLLPILVQVGRYVGGELKSAWDSFAKSIVTLEPLLKVIGYILGVVIVAAIVLVVGAIAAMLAIGATLLNWIAKATEAFLNMGAPIFNLFKKIPASATDMYNGIVNALSDIPGFFKRVFGAAASAIGSIDWSEVGRAIIRGIGVGLLGMSGWLADQAISAVAGAKDKLKGFLGIHSPSTVMRDEVGKMLGLGIAEGITASSSTVVGAMRNTSDTITNGFGDLSSGYSLTGEASFSAGIDTSSLGGVGGGGQDVSININLSGIMSRSRTDEREIAKSLVESINQELRAKQLPEIGGGALRGAV